MFYLPVDMSSEMLRLGTLEPVRGIRFPMAQVLPVQLDFSLATNLDELRQMLDRLVDDEPLLYALTGNTLANFDDDPEALATITRALRPQDRLLLEVATYHPDRPGGGEGGGRRIPPDSGVRRVRHQRAALQHRPADRSWIG